MVRSSLLSIPTIYDHGNPSDRAIGVPLITRDGHVIEASLFSGAEKPKHIVVISSQISCPMKCTFCELGEERFIRNLTSEEMVEEVRIMTDIARGRGVLACQEPTKVTVANSGEPLLNQQLIAALETISLFGVSFKVSTVFPAGSRAKKLFEHIATFASRNETPVQIQISIISTDESDRQARAGSRVATFEELREAGDFWRQTNPSGRKINLSLIVSDDTPCDPEAILSHFPPEHFCVRFREYVPTANGARNGLRMIESDRLAELKSLFRAHGYERLDAGSPTPTEWKYGLVGNSFRTRYVRERMTTSP